MIYEVEFAPGLLAIVRDETTKMIENKGHIIASYRDDSLQFTYEGDFSDLFALRTVISLYQVMQFEIPRPKALLGHEHFHRLVNAIQEQLDLQDYDSLYVSAAGSESAVMQRIKTELGQYLNLEIGDEEGDLLLRMRRTPKTKQGWDILFRLTPRPLATREWRVCNYEGALNASVAAAIVKLTNPTEQDHFLNIACGSGTMMIERASTQFATLSGCDISSDVLRCASENLSASNFDDYTLLQSDAIQLPFMSQSIDKLVADLPFGQLVGSHDENEWLYPAILHEAGRIAKKKARFVIISHEIRLMDSILSNQHSWKLINPAIKITLSGLHPRIYVLERQ